MVIDIYIFLENLSSLFAYKNFHQDSFIIQASDRLGALFGVSILEDKDHTRNELWYVVYQMSSVICKCFTFSFEYISTKKSLLLTGFRHILHWISDSESCQRLI